MNGHNRLIRRNHTYYLRARIPTHLTYLIHKSQFCYSLKTNIYKQALAKLSKERCKKISLTQQEELKNDIKNKVRVCVILQKYGITKPTYYRYKENFGL